MEQENDRTEVELTEKDIMENTPIEVIVKEPLPEILERHLKNIRHICAAYLNEGEEVHPQFILVDANGQGHALDPSDGMKPDMKHLVAQWITEMAEEVNAVAIFFITEGWALKRSKEEGWQRDMSQHISDHPDKIEVLMIQVETINGTWSGSMELGPANPGTPREIRGAMELDKMEAVGGLFNNLLPQNADVLKVCEEDFALKRKENLH